MSINNDGNVDSYLKSNFNLETESVSILKATSSISKHGDVVTFREEVRTHTNTHTLSLTTNNNDNTHREKKSSRFIPISVENTENC
jgi:hypothetical protein